MSAPKDKTGKEIGVNDQLVYFANEGNKSHMAIVLRIGADGALFGIKLARRGVWHTDAVHVLDGYQFDRLVRTYDRDLDWGGDQILRDAKDYINISPSRAPPAPPAPPAVIDVNRKELPEDDPILYQPFSEGQDVIRIGKRNNWLFDGVSLSKYWKDQGKKTNPLVSGFNGAVLNDSEIERGILHIVEESKGGRRRKTRKHSRRSRKTRRSRK